MDPRRDNRPTCIRGHRRECSLLQHVFARGSCSSNLVQPRPIDVCDVSVHHNRTHFGLSTCSRGPVVPKWTIGVPGQSLLFGGVIYHYPHTSEENRLLGDAAGVLFNSKYRCIQDDLHSSQRLSQSRLAVLNGLHDDGRMVCSNSPIGLHCR